MFLPGDTARHGQQRPGPQQVLAAAEPRVRIMLRLGAYVGSRWTVHTLRHWFATSAYAAERDLRAVQELLGRSNPRRQRSMPRSSSGELGGAEVATPNEALLARV